MQDWDDESSNVFADRVEAQGLQNTSSNWNDNLAGNIGNIGNQNYEMNNYPNDNMPRDIPHDGCNNYNNVNDDNNRYLNSDRMDSHRNNYNMNNNGNQSHSQYNNYMDDQRNYNNMNNMNNMNNIDNFDNNYNNYNNYKNNFDDYRGVNNYNDYNGHNNYNPHGAYNSPRRRNDRNDRHDRNFGHRGGRGRRGGYRNSRGDYNNFNNFNNNHNNHNNRQFRDFRDQKRRNNNKNKNKNKKNKNRNQYNNNNDHNGFDPNNPNNPNNGNNPNQRDTGLNYDPNESRLRSRHQLKYKAKSPPNVSNSLDTDADGPRVARAIESGEFENELKVDANDGMDARNKDAADAVDPVDPMHATDAQVEEKVAETESKTGASSGDARKRAARRPENGRKKSKFSRRVISDTMSGSEEENSEDADGEDKYSQFKRKYDSHMDDQDHFNNNYATNAPRIQPNESMNSMNNNNNNDINNNYKHGKTGDVRERRVATRLGLSKRAETMIEQLFAGSYDCMICQSKVGRKARIWACSHCDTIFHMTCINRWAETQEKREAEAQNRPKQDPRLIRSLRCPACNFEHKNSFRYDAYFCYCGKVCFDHLPKHSLQSVLSTSNIPHSCGEMCGRPKSKGGECQHPCVAVCHPGSCQTCRLPSNIERRCACGKMTYRLLCGQTEKQPKLCSDACGKMLSCKRHHCDKTCHHGNCDPCTVTYHATCFCGQHSRDVRCEEVIEKKSEESDSDVSYYFKCGNVCNKVLACGNHRCNLYCHDGPCVECKRRVQSPPLCACGKTRFRKGSKAFDNPRGSCLEPLPTCNNKCGKLLSCNQHFCQMTCHDSPCKDCNIKVKKSCRCGSDTKTFGCTDYQRKLRAALASGDPEVVVSPDAWIRCRRVCKKILSCGFHDCRVNCCPGKKIVGYHGHICQQTCGRELNCKRHRCDSRCHSGACDPCPVTYSQGYTCPCGNVYVPGPFRCGNRKIPTCTQKCFKFLPCGHECYNRCHEGPCPTKCPMLVTKYCETHYKPVYNIQCFVEHVSCGDVCGKLLSCQQHYCKRKCHAGPCESEKELLAGCAQKCAEILVCGHKCPSRCHSKQGRDCNPKWCKVSIAVKCQCGNRTEMQQCRGRTTMEVRAIMCNEQCVVEERNKRFRDAFGLTPSHDMQHSHYSNSSHNQNQSQQSSNSTQNQKKSQQKQQKQGKQQKQKQRAQKAQQAQQEEQNVEQVEGEGEAEGEADAAEAVEVLKIPYARQVLERVIEHMAGDRGHKKMSYGQYKEKLKNGGASGVVRLGNGMNKNENGVDAVEVTEPSFVQYVEGVLDLFISDGTDNLEEFSKKYPKLKNEDKGAKSVSIMITDCNKDKRYILYSMLTEYHLNCEQIVFKTSKGKGGKKQKIGVVIKKCKDYSSVPAYLLSQAVVLYQVYGRNGVQTLESIASWKCMIVVDNICGSQAMKSDLIQEKLNKFRGDFKMWRSSKVDVLNRVTNMIEAKQSLYLVFTNEELRNDAMNVMTQFGGRKAKESDMNELA